jgi:hypothetical protein
MATHSTAFRLLCRSAAHTRRGRAANDDRAIDKGGEIRKNMRRNVEMTAATDSD